MPYEEMIKVIKSNDSSDIYELLDYIEEKIHSNYPREEIKKHLLDCIFVKEYEEKHKEGVKKYEKNLFQRLRKYFDKEIELSGFVENIRNINGYSF